MDMYDIELKSPFGIRIRILEFEEKTVSVKILINYFIVLFQEKAIEINNSVWIKCSQWDNFISQFYKIVQGEYSSAILKNLSDEIIFQIIRKEVQEVMITLYYNKEMMGGVKIRSSISAILDEEQMKIICEKFASIEKW